MNIWTLVEWFFYGLVRYVLFWVPVVNPFSVEVQIPWQWWYYNDFWDWLHRDRVGGGPDEHWLRCWFKMVWGESKKLVLSEAARYTDNARNWLRDRIGALKVGFSNVGQWVDWLERRIGHYLPSFAPTVSAGLNWLRYKLPVEIRNGWQSWTQWIDAIKSSLGAWVRSVYDYAKERALASWAWVVDRGEFLRWWVDRVRGWVDAFRADPYGTITGWLGSAWAWLRSFRDRGRDIVLGWLGPDIHSAILFWRDAVRFYYNLWSIGWRVLGEFVSDPLGYLYDRAERILIKEW